MIDVNRYYMYVGDGPGLYPEIEPDGDWVLFEDYEALLLKTDRMEKALELIASFHNFEDSTYSLAASMYEASCVAKAALQGI